MAECRGQDLTGAGAMQMTKKRELLSQKTFLELDTITPIRTGSLLT